MNGRMIARIVGSVLLLLAAFLLLPLIVGLIYRENVLGFGLTAALALGLGLLLTLVFKPVRTDLYAREGFTAVGLVWLSMSLIGALPLVINGDIPRYIDAFFEISSGFTTTGASVLPDVEALSRSGQFWRIFTHWLGGMGVLVFVMAVMPLSGDHSMHIMRAEIPGPSVGKLVPRARKTAIILYLIYIGLTVSETVLLMFGHMSFYEALLHAFASAGTGGFSTRADSIAAFNSPYIELVIAVFLIFFGTNFNLFYLILIGRPKEALRSEELHWYWGILLGSVIAITAGILPIYGSLGTSLRHAFFNVCTISSTAGFGTEDFTKWPGYIQTLLVLLMFIGGCGGSTGGGLKLSRVMLLVKTAAADVKKIVRPRSVNRVQLDGQRVSADTCRAVYTYFALYMLILLACAFLVSFDGYDFSTNFTAALSCMSNIGPGLSMIGPKGSFAIFSDFSKLVLAITMLFGRLEIYAMLILFLPSTWKRHG
ncbi:MAG: TrkH family potassium uptake protein [Oscillospiraceae bacterium]|nr:TrkH family potassium uptake protein [Oscillospiraceae bacterium]